MAFLVLLTITFLLLLANSVASYYIISIASDSSVTGDFRVPGVSITGVYSVAGILGFLAIVSRVAVDFNVVGDASVSLVFSITISVVW